jgi:hypothetical protein
VEGQFFRDHPAVAEDAKRALLFSSHSFHSNSLSCSFDVLAGLVDWRKWINYPAGRLTSSAITIATMRLIAWHGA